MAADLPAGDLRARKLTGRVPPLRQAGPTNSARRGLVRRAPAAFACPAGFRPGAANPGYVARITPGHGDGTEVTSMKRVVLALAVASVAALLAPAASAETCVQYGRTPYQKICLYPR